MSSVAYEQTDGIATISIDDGKVNALSAALLGEIGEALDRAQADAAVAILRGREGTFSAGFDLRCEPEGWPEMLVAGARVARRILSFPQPVVLACHGNAIAMGGFLLLCADHRIGVRGDAKIGLNEVAIGMTIPWFGISIARHRLARPWYDRCTVTGTLLGPDDALSAGFLDELCEGEELEGAAREAATRLAGVDRDAHVATKLRVRAGALEGIDDGIDRIEGSGREW